MTVSMYGAGAEYALHSLLILASREEAVSIKDLAGFQQIPERFLAKLFARMKKARLVRGTEGISGGFNLARPATEIAVLEVLDAVDPDRSLFACAEIRRNCTLFGAEPPGWAVSGPCRIHAFMEEAERQLRQVLASKTVAELACEFDSKTPREFGQEAEAWFKQAKLNRTCRK